MQNVYLPLLVAQSLVKVFFLTFYFHFHRSHFLFSSWFLLVTLAKQILRAQIVYLDFECLFPPFFSPQFCSIAFLSHVDCYTTFFPFCFCFSLHLLPLFYPSVWRRSENGDADFDEPTTCCKLCKCCTPCYASALCLPCRRLKKCSCCRRGAKKLADEQKAAGIGASSILHESEKRVSVAASEAANSAAAANASCWRRLKCCKRKSNEIVEEKMDEVRTMSERTMQRAESMADSAQVMATKERGKCALCLAKVFCCRKTNKIQTSTQEMMSAQRTSSVEHEIDEEPDERRCCCCLPCRRKPKDPLAWSEQRRHDSLHSTDQLPKK